MSLIPFGIGCIIFLMKSTMKKTEAKKRATIKDVAVMAGVTTATVSFVLNNTPGQTISEATRAHVLECANKLSYRKHYLASSIRSGTSRTIALVSTYKRSHLYFLDFINGVMKEAEETDYGVLICPNHPVGEQARCIRYYLEGRIEGVIFISSAHSEQSALESDFIQMFRRFSVPFVVIYGYTDEPDVSYIKSDMYTDGLTACRLLLQNGCRRIGYIGALSKDNTAAYQPQTEIDRISGYKDALAEAGLRETVMHLPRNFRDADYEALLQQFRQADLDGYVVCWGTYGIQLLTALHLLGKRVPQEIKVIALDSLPYLDHIDPPLTAMSLPFFEMAQAGTRVLLDMLKNPEAPAVRKSFPSQLERRASV